MKNLVAFIFCILSFSVYSQTPLSIEPEFKLDPTLLDEMELAFLPDDIRAIGITQPPGRYTDKKIINRFFRKGDLENILDVYFEVYITTDVDYDDAGVIVVHFNSEESLLKNVLKMKE